MHLGDAGGTRGRPRPVRHRDLRRRRGEPGRPADRSRRRPVLRRFQRWDGAPHQLPHREPGADGDGNRERDQRPRPARGRVRRHRLLRPGRGRQPRLRLGPRWRRAVRRLGRSPAELHLRRRHLRGAAEGRRLQRCQRHHGSDHDQRRRAANPAELMRARFAERPRRDASRGDGSAGPPPTTRSSAWAARTSPSGSGATTASSATPGATCSAAGRARISSWAAEAATSWPEAPAGTWCAAGQGGTESSSRAGIASPATASGSGAAEIAGVRPLRTALDRHLLDGLGRAGVRAQGGAGRCSRAGLA